MPTWESRTPRPRLRWWTTLADPLRRFGCYRRTHLHNAETHGLGQASSLPHCHLSVGGIGWTGAPTCSFSVLSHLSDPLKRNQASYRRLK